MSARAIRPIGTESPIYADKPNIFPGPARFPSVGGAFRSRGSRGFYISDMNWLNLHTAVLDSPEFIGSDPVERSTWLCLLRYCIGQENGGIIKGCSAWKPDQWKAILVRRRDVLRESALWRWESGDLILPYDPERVYGETRIPPVRLPYSQWERLRGIVFKRDGRACAYCGAVGEELHCDHIIPLVRGGSNLIENLATACRSCNLSKGAKSLAQWKGGES